MLYTDVSTLPDRASLYVLLDVTVLTIASAVIFDSADLSLVSSPSFSLSKLSTLVVTPDRFCSIVDVLFSSAVTFEPSALLFTVVVSFEMLEELASAVCLTSLTVFDSAVTVELSAFVVTVFVSDVMFALFSSTVFLRVLNTDVSTFVETAVCAASAFALASFAVV